MKNQILSSLFVLTMLMSTEHALGMKPVAPPTVQATVAPAGAAAGSTARVDEAKTATEPATHAPLWPTVRGRLSVGGKESTISAAEEKTLLDERERDANSLPLLSKHAIKAAAYGSITAFQDLLNRELFRPYLADPENKDGQALARKLFATAGYQGYAQICELLLPFTNNINETTFCAVLHGKLFAMAESLILRFEPGKRHGIMYATLEDVLSKKNHDACDFILGKLSADQARMILTIPAIFGLAAENGNVTVVQQCLKHKINPNIQVGTHTWETALYSAAKNKQEAVCKVLIKSRAQVFLEWDPAIQAFAFRMIEEE